MLIAIPAAIGLIVFSLPLISSCFAYGKFNAFDTLQTQKSLITLGAGIPAFMLVKVLASAFYARQDIKTPVKIGAVAMLVNSLLCALLIYPLAHAGLALASSLAGYLNCGLLYLWLRRRNWYQPQKGWGKYAIQLLLANSVMALYLVLQARELHYWLAFSATQRLAHLLGHVAVAICIYLGLLLIVGLRPHQFKGQIRKTHE